MPRSFFAGSLHEAAVEEVLWGFPMPAGAVSRGLLGRGRRELLIDHRWNLELSHHHVTSEPYYKVT